MDNTALLIVDVQNALVSDKPYNLEATLINIKKLLEACRRSGQEIIYIQHDGVSDENLEPFSKGWDIHSTIYPKKDEKRIRKAYNSAFKETELEGYLKAKNITSLILVGMQTEYCIDTTCRVAFEKGYKLIMPEYTNTTFDNGSLTGKEIYEHHNLRIFKNQFAKMEDVEKVIQDLEDI